MALFGKNPNEAAYTGGKKHWADVIKNTGPGELLIWRQPEEDFNTISTLIVMPGEEAIRALYDELDKECGIDTSGIELHINSRLARRHGQCHYKADTDGKTLVPWKIDIAGFLVNNPEGFWNTARHEYAHALVTLRDGKRHGHDKVWQAAAVEVGAIPRAYNTIESAGKACEAFRTQNAKYHLVCEKCGHEWFYMRETAVIRNVFRHVRNPGICPTCRGRKFTVKELR